MKRKFRIKTIDEFKEDYGKEWRKKVIFSFPLYMDSLLNMNITSLMDEEKIKKFDSRDANSPLILTLYRIDGGKMNISYEMIIECHFGEKLKKLLTL